MQHRLVEAGFHVKRRLTVSHFRLPLLKRLLPARMLAAADSLCQPTGAWWQLTPSIFVQCTQPTSTADPTASQFFRCPACHSTTLHPGPELLTCEQCETRWPIEDGIYNFTFRPTS